MTDICSQIDRPDLRCYLEIMLNNTVKRLSWSCNNILDLFMLRTPYSRDKDPVGSVDFWPARSGSITFFHWIRILPVTMDL